MGDDVKFYTISVDLPFTQGRWAKEAGVGTVTMLSDYQERSFGENYGVLIKELKALARAIFVVDKNDAVTYVEIVPEVASEPNYDAAIAAAQAAAGA